MGIIDSLKKSANKLFSAKEKKDVKDTNSHYGGGYSVGNGFFFSQPYDGEKTEGELGLIKDYYPNHHRLAARAWQLYLESDIAHAIMNTFVFWIIGDGLKLQTEPDKQVLEAKSINLDTDLFSNTVESFFSLHSNSKESSYNQQGDIHEVAEMALKYAYIAGDCLVRFRITDDGANAQVIDGRNIIDPLENSLRNSAEARGNRIVNGIEQNKSGKHIAYYVLERNGKVKRIAARSQGRVVATMIYGLKHRSFNRGIPLMSAVMESLKKLERYKEATIGAAEEVAKIVYYIYHNETSTGEHFTTPNATNRRAALDLDNDYIREDYIENIIETTQKNAINMPRGAELRKLSAENDMYYKDFFIANFDVICATLGIPPEVVMQKFGQSFSASRVSTKMLEQNVKVKRKKFYKQFYQPFYELWLESSMLQGVIDLEGLRTALFTDRYSRSAVLKCSFIGINVPHIDPKKEADAMRVLLGEKLENVPLINIDRATTELNGGDHKSNFAKTRSDLDLIKEVIPELVAETPPEEGEEQQEQSNNNNNNLEDGD